MKTPIQFRVVLKINAEMNALDLFSKITSSIYKYHIKYMKYHDENNLQLYI